MTKPDNIPKRSVVERKVEEGARLLNTLDTVVANHHGTRQDHETLTVAIATMRSFLAYSSLYAETLPEDPPEPAPHELKEAEQARNKGKK